MVLMTLKEKVENAVARHPEWTPAYIAGRITTKRERVTADDVRNVLDQINSSPKTKPQKTPSKKQKIGIGENELRIKHDPYYQIEHAAQGIMRGTYIEDSDFRDHVVQMNKNLYRRPADSPQFNAYKGVSISGSITYWGHPESIKEKKEEGVLR
jgi:hypothetical protein